MRANSTTRSSISASNEGDIAVIVFKSEGDPAQVLAYDAFLDANKSNWLAREIRLYWKRVLKRVDLTSRTLVAIVEPGSCFAGTLAEIVLACDRSYMLIGQLNGGNRPPVRSRSAANFGAYPMPNGISRLESRFLEDSRASLDAAKATIGECSMPRRRKARPRHLRLRRHRLGRRDPHLPGRARELLARRAHRSRSELALRRAGDDGIENLRELTAWQN